MDFKKLNEELQKFLEISTTTVNKVNNIRGDQYGDAKGNFRTGKGSLSSLQKAKSKLDRNNELIKQREIRQNKAAKHTIIGDGVYFNVKNGKYKCDLSQVVGLTDEDLIRLALLVPNSPDITTIEEARAYFDNPETPVKLNVLLKNIENKSFDTNYSGAEYHIFLDKTPQEVCDLLNGSSEKSRKKVDKYRKYSTNTYLYKLVQKGQVDEESVTTNINKRSDGPDHIRYTFDILIKNPGFPDEFILDDYLDLDEFKEYMKICSKWNLPTPESQKENGHVGYYRDGFDDCDILWEDRKTLRIKNVVGFEKLEDED